MSPATARAHPFGDTVVAQRLDVDVEPGRLRVGLVIDAPPEALEQAGGVLTPAAWLERMANAVAVSVDGVTATPTLERSDERLDLVGMHTRTFEVVLALPIDLSAPRKIEVTNGNLLGQGGWYVSTVTLNPAVRHLDSSLVVTPRRGSTVDLSGQWSRSELRRRVQLTLDAPPTLWRRLVARLGLTAIGPSDATPSSPASAWRRRLGTADALGFAALLGLMVGACAGAASVNRRNVAVPVALSGAAWASGVAVSTPAGLTALAAIAVVAAWRGRLPLPLAAVVLGLSAAPPHQALTWAALTAGLVLGAGVAAPWRGLVPAVAGFALTVAALCALAA